MKWSGVVMAIRPINYDDGCTARLQSARTVQNDGKRILDIEVPYAMVRHYFGAGDNDHAFIEASFDNGDLNLHNRAIAGLQSWVLHSLTEEQRKMP
jgi:hypothetical protein